MESIISISAVPKPSTNAMMLVGLLGVGFMVRRKKLARYRFKVIWI